MQERALAGYRVLHLTDEQGWLGAKVLTNLGADVGKVGLPTGDPGCLSNPSYEHTADADKSPPEFTYNTDTRRICLDCLQANLPCNPLWLSITLGGQDEPRRDVQRSDRSCMALDDLRGFVGAAKGRSVRLALPQVAAHAGVQAARLLGIRRSRRYSHDDCGTDDDRQTAARGRWTCVCTAADKRKMEKTRGGYLP